MEVLCAVSLITGALIAAVLAYVIIEAKKSRESVEAAMNALQRQLNGTVQTVITLREALLQGGTLERSAQLPAPPSERHAVEEAGATKLRPSSSSKAPEIADPTTERESDRGTFPGDEPE